MTYFNGTDPYFNAPDPDACICSGRDGDDANPACPLHGIEADKHDVTLESIKAWFLRFGIVNDALAGKIAAQGWDSDGTYDDEHICVYTHDVFGQVLNIDKHYITPGWRAHYWWDDSVQFEGLLEWVVQYCVTHTDESPECLAAAAELAK